MNSMMMWFRVCVAVISLACVVAPSTTLAADDDDDRDRPSQIQQPMPNRGVCPPGMCGATMLPHRPRCPYSRCLLKCVLIWIAVVHVLLASWVFTDIRKRGEGHGIFVVLALLAGIPATILYALVRIGDTKKT